MHILDTVASPPSASSPSQQPPKAIDLGHHVNTLSKSRHPSPLKDILKYMYQDGMISLAGGLPHPSLFPYSSITAEVYPADTFVDPATIEPPAALERIEVSKDGTQTADKPVNLTTALQYGACTGLKPLLDFARDFTRDILHPAYSDYEILLNNGNTDGWSKVANLLLEPNEMILVEEHTYPSSMAHWIPTGCKAVPLKMDGEGILAKELDEVLVEWEDRYPGQKKPHVLYTVPVGQNPTGATSGLNRKTEIYEVAVKHDIVIVEDDPYYFLQYDDYVPGVAARPCDNPQTYLDKLVPSYLKIDTQGRVIRLDTFSKTLAPGSRLGYFVCNPLFAERLLRATEVVTQTPSGWSQAIVAHQLAKWGQQGYVHWLSNLCEQYRVRRDWLCEALEAHFELVPAADRPELGIQGTLAYFKGTKTAGAPPLFSFVCPTAGMFFWCRFYLTQHPDFAGLKADSAIDDPEETLMNKLWMQLTQAMVLLTPGSYYHPFEGQFSLKTEKNFGHFRLAFSVATRPQLLEAIQRMEGALRKSYNALMR